MPVAYQSLADYFGYSTAYDNRNGLGDEWEIHKSLDVAKRRHMLITDASGTIIGQQHLVDDLRSSWTRDTCKTIGQVSELFSYTRGIITILESLSAVCSKSENIE